jgi:ubiquinol-cytochrome c reductase cytochrome c1 subunit
MDKRYSNTARRITVLLGAFLATTGAYASGSSEMEPAGNDVDNIQSLQRGARNFMNYCSGCHSARYVRYNTVARDLDLTDDQVANNLMFNADKTFETIQASMPDDDAGRWFGQPPPDMSLIARAKGTDYIYNFLKGFYLDADSPTGVDNHLLEGTSMPHVLWDLQGFQKAVYRDEPVRGKDGATRQVFDKLEAVTAGTMSTEDFDGFVRDTVNFLAYIAEPERSTRRTVGVWVLIFLIFFLILSIMLKKEIWKDVS